MRVLPWRHRRREARLAERETFRAARRLLDEDVTVFGEQVADLHVQTLLDELSESMQLDYQAALAAYDDAKAALAACDSGEDVARAGELLVEGRFRTACLLARRDGRPLPERREPCFFNPRHGPASSETSWTPPGGVARDIAVCFMCEQRLQAGEEPDHRVVRVGDRWLPLYRAGSTLAEVTGAGAHTADRDSSWRTRSHGAEAMVRGTAQRYTGGLGS